MSDKKLDLVKGDLVMTAYGKGVVMATDFGSKNMCIVKVNGEILYCKSQELFCLAQKDHNLDTQLDCSPVNQEQDKVKRIRDYCISQRMDYFTYDPEYHVADMIIEFIDQLDSNEGES